MMASNHPSSASRRSSLSTIANYIPQDLWTDNRLPVKTLCRFRCLCKSWNSLNLVVAMMASNHPSSASRRRRSSPSTIANYIPQDLWTDNILKRLPVKTLCRFRCVCKSWNSRLSSPSFASLQLRFTATATTKTTYSQASAARYDSVTYTLHSRDGRITCLDFPNFPSFFRFTIIGVVHGVVCYAYLPDRPDPVSPYRIGLWNPAIRKHIDIHWPSQPESRRLRYLKGLGFNTSTNDFKLVFCESDHCNVFSVPEGVWTTRPLPHDISSHLHHPGEGCFLNGTIHWLLEDDSASLYYSLLLFECEREEFRTMDLPEEAQRVEVWPRVFVYDGLLQLLISELDSCEVWKMEEYGDTTTWSRVTIMGSKLEGYDELEGYFMPKGKDESDDDERQISLSGIGALEFVFKESMFLMDIGT